MKDNFYEQQVRYNNSGYKNKENVFGRFTILISIRKRRWEINGLSVLAEYEGLF
ncbi:MAG: hypothetical protein ABIY51_08125 [Ferruginibacter sp.]